jgi:hypothetical protein
MTELPDADISHAIERGRQAMLAEKVDGMRAALARQWEEEILEGLPEVCQWVRSDIDELAARKQATRRAYQKRVARFVRWASERGFDRLPYAPAVVARFFIDETNRGMSVGEIKLIRAAIASVHREAGFAEPCQDPLVRAIVRFLDTRPPGDDDDGGEPMPAEHQAAA